MLTNGNNCKNRLILFFNSQRSAAAHPPSFEKGKKKMILVIDKEQFKGKRQKELFVYCMQRTNNAEGKLSKKKSIDETRQQ